MTWDHFTDVAPEQQGTQIPEPGPTDEYRVESQNPDGTSPKSDATPPRDFNHIDSVAAGPGIAPLFFKGGLDLEAGTYKVHYAWGKWSRTDSKFVDPGTDPWKWDVYFANTTYEGTTGFQLIGGTSMSLPGQKAFVSYGELAFFGYRNERNSGIDVEETSRGLSITFSHPGGPLGVRYVGDAAASGNVVWSLGRSTEPPVAPPEEKFVNVTVDSNNDGTVNERDDWAEGGYDLVATIDNLDVDTDGKPDFADPQVANLNFYPMKVTLPAGVNFNTARLRFDYDASDPTRLVLSGSSLRPGYAPAADQRGGLGQLRIWSVPASTQRDFAGAARGGHFITPGVPVTLSQLGVPAGTQTFTVYIEAVGSGWDHRKGVNNYAETKRIHVALADDGTNFTMPDTVRVRTVFSRAGWQAKVFELSRFDPSTWNTSQDFNYNAQNVYNIYDFYREIYRMNPDKFLWAGGAVIFSASLFDSSSMFKFLEREFGSSDLLISTSNMTTVVSKLREQWLNIAFSIFNDIAWQHLAFAAGHMDEMTRLNDNGGLSNITGNPVNLLGAWNLIAHGGSSGVRSGSETLMRYEQTVVIKENYRSIEAIEPLRIQSVVGISKEISIPMLLTLASRARDPLPGMSTYFQWAKQRYGLMSLSSHPFTNNNDRFQYMKEILWPFWTNKSRSDRDAMVRLELRELSGSAFTLFHK